MTATPWCQYINTCQSINTCDRDSIVPKKKPATHTLATREQQIMDVIYQLERASVADVRQRLANPPSYSAVRTMIGHLERKGLIRRDRSDVKHYYSPVQSRRSASRSALRSLIQTFFPNSPGDALAALIDDSAKHLKEEDLDRLQLAIQKARKQEK
ncbi:Transcriptional repressor CopY [Bythopirellula goksoeyrii]|uniref:Transcriptional repressor CopY n=1 Tax=Bythopirellula goksoeyrii TaxID=1400387 RepID=A0A5B9QD36_9BACT|nr:Transcriptional repressor CopY [Bythopirellula goksoeyrii]